MSKKKKNLKKKKIKEKFANNNSGSIFFGLFFGVIAIGMLAALFNSYVESKNQSKQIVSLKKIKF